MHVCRSASCRCVRFFALIPLLASVFASAQKHTVQPADIAGMKTIEAPRISPDGKFIAYAVTTPMPAEKPHNEHIWLVPADHSAPGRLFISGSGSDTAPAWSP